METLSLTKVLVMLIQKKRSDQKLFLDNRSSIESETSSNTSLPLAFNNELQVSIRFGHSAMNE
jgi:hypothetical protein